MKIAIFKPNQVLIEFGDGKTYAVRPNGDISETLVPPGNHPSDKIVYDDTPKPSVYKILDDDCTTIDDDYYVAMTPGKNIAVFEVGDDNPGGTVHIVERSYHLRGGDGMEEFFLAHAAAIKFLDAKEGN